MALTFGEFKEIIAPYAGRAGKCPSATQMNSFARMVMEYLLYSGTTSAIRKICVCTHRGCISLPPEVEIPLKARVDRQVAEIWSKWFTMHSADDLDNCGPIGSILQEEGSQTPLAYELPQGGARVAVVGNCEEADDAFVIVQGKDPTGRIIYSQHKGEQITGEKFSIKKHQARFGEITFGEITHVLKSKTKGYVSLSTYDPARNDIGQFLADWSPMEEKPLYRKFKVISKDCGRTSLLSILCRVRLRDNYHDNELTLFDNHLAVLLAAQRIQSEVNSDSDTASYKSKAVDDILEKEAGYKKKNGGPMDVFKGTSGSSIRNII